MVFEKLTPLRPSPPRRGGNAPSVLKFLAEGCYIFLKSARGLAQVRRFAKILFWKIAEPYFFDQAQRTLLVLKMRRKTFT
jgi:hypothetical protein